MVGAGDGVDRRSLREESKAKQSKAWFPGAGALVIGGQATDAGPSDKSKLQLQHTGRTALHTKFCLTEPSPSTRHIPPRPQPRSKKGPGQKLIYPQPLHHGVWKDLFLRCEVPHSLLPFRLGCND